MEPEFSPAVTALLKLGEPRGRDWLRYSALGITSRDIPELRRILEAPEFDFLPADQPEVWASMHAWRALAELRAPEVVPLLLERFDEFTVDDFDDRLTDDFSRAMADVGPAALDPLIAYLSDPAKQSDNRMSAAVAIAAVGREHAEARPRALDALVSGLRDWRRNAPELNGGLVSGLINLRAQDTMPLIREAMAAGAVDEMFTGSVEYVEYDLGLRDGAPPRRPYTDPTLAELSRSIGSDPRQKRNAKERARARRKQAKAAKRWNRRK